MRQTIRVERLLRESVETPYCNLVTRTTGRLVRSSIARALEADGAPLALLDFSDVGLVDFSCADEIVAKLLLDPPTGAMYAFVGIDREALPDFDDQRFALDLLEQKHVLVAPGVSFNVPYRTHFRVTSLPDPATLRMVFGRIEELLQTYASAPASGASTVVPAASRFK